MSKAKPLSQAVQRLLALYGLKAGTGVVTRSGARTLTNYAVRRTTSVSDRLTDGFSIDHLDSVEIVLWAITSWQDIGMVPWSKAPYKEKWRRKWAANL